MYAGYEIAWADRIFEILTPEQRVALAGAIDPTELFERSGDRASDLGDVARVTVIPAAVKKALARCQNPAVVTFFSSVRISL